MTNIDKIADLLEKLARETSIIICDPKYGFLYDEVHTLRLKLELIPIFQEVMQNE